MSDAVKFLFDTSFDADETAGSAPSRPKPAFTEADLAAARQQAFAAGRDEGMAAARAEADAVAAGALRQLVQVIGSLGKAQAASDRRRGQEAAALALAIAGKLAPTLLSRQPLAEIEALVARCLVDLHDEPRIVIRASEAASEALPGRLAEITAAAGFPGQIVLLPDPALTGSDCRVEWADGGAERDFETLLARAETAVQRILTQADV